MLEHQLLIAAVWFPLYWLFGGVFFAVVTIARVVKLRRGRFSCLFTLLTIGFSYGAAYTGLAFSRERVDACLIEAVGFFDTIAAVFACGILEILAAGALWFSLLLVCGFAVLILSKAENQSWVDSKQGFEDKDEGFIYFDEEAHERH